MDRQLFAALATIIIMLSLIFLAVDNLAELFVCRMTQGTPKLLAIFESLVLSGTILRPLLRSGMFLLTIIFVLLGFMNDCWCAPPWQWQIGALALFMAYINFLFLLKGLPLLGVYIPINMLFNIVTTFLKLIYLPILLILSFAFPFYMLFVRDTDAVMVSFLKNSVQLFYSKIYIVCNRKKGFLKLLPLLLAPLSIQWSRVQEHWISRVFLMMPTPTWSILPWPTSSSLHLWCLCQFFSSLSWLVMCFHSEIAYTCLNRV